MVLLYWRRCIKEVGRKRSEEVRFTSRCRGDTIRVSRGRQFDPLSRSSRKEADPLEPSVALVATWCGFGVEPVAGIIISVKST